LEEGLKMKQGRLTETPQNFQNLRLPDSANSVIKAGMSTPDDPLWSKLEAFEFDVPGAHLTFTQRLMRENGWGRDYSQRVIQEYRRFLFLAMRAGHSVTPSDQVDQAWHLHLVYSRSYWDELCAEVLGRPLHHGPTRGGSGEDQRYWSDYEKTRESYQRLFGQPPPADIWPEPSIRFSPVQKWQRVDTGACWMISKTTTRRALRSVAAVAAFGFLMVACGASEGGSGVDWGLVFVIGFFVSIVLLAAWRSRKHRPRDKDGSGCSTFGGCGSFGGGGASGCGSSHSDSSGCGSSGCGSSGGCGGGGGD
jgi:hypothetical protein